MSEIPQEVACLAEPEVDIPSMLDLINRGVLSAGYGIEPHAHRDAVIGIYMTVNPEKAAEWDTYFAKKDLAEYEAKQDPDLQDIISGMEATLVLDSYEVNSGLPSKAALFMRTETAKHDFFGEAYPGKTYEPATIEAIVAEITDSGESLDSQIVGLALNERVLELFYQAETRLRSSIFGADFDRTRDAYVAKTLVSRELMRFRDVAHWAPGLLEWNNQAIEYLQQNDLINDEVEAVAQNLLAGIAKRYRHPDPNVRKAGLTALADLRTRYPDEREYRKLARRVRASYGVTSIIPVFSQKGQRLSGEEDALVRQITDDLLLPTVLPSDFEAHARIAGPTIGTTVLQD